MGVKYLTHKGRWASLTRSIVTLCHKCSHSTAFGPHYTLRIIRPSIIPANRLLIGGRAVVVAIIWPDSVNSYPNISIAFISLYKASLKIYWFTTCWIGPTYAVSHFVNLLLTVLGLHGTLIHISVFIRRTHRLSREKLYWINI